MQIIPAIDIIDGKCVRLEEGNYDKVTLYHREPVDMAKKFENAGLTRLHLVDLDGARAGSVKNWRVLERIAAKTSLVVDFGGGIKTGKDVEIVFNSGSLLATVGSPAARYSSTALGRPSALEGNTPISQHARISGTSLRRPRNRTFSCRPSRAT